MLQHEPERAGFMDRAVAFAIDASLFCLLIWAAAHGLAALSGWDAVGVFTSSGSTWRFQASGLFMRVVLLIALAYNVGFWLRGRGATPGKRALRLRVTVRDGSPLRVGQAIGRTFPYLVSLPFLAGFLWAAVDRRGEAFHDKLAGTAVTRGP